MRGISNNGLTLVSPVRNVNTIASTGPAPVTFFTLKASTHKASKPTEFDFKNLTLEHLAASSLQKIRENTQGNSHICIVTLPSSHSFCCTLQVFDLIVEITRIRYPRGTSSPKKLPDFKMHGPPGYFRTTGDFCCSRPWMS